MALSSCREFEWKMPPILVQEWVIQRGVAFPSLEMLSEIIPQPDKQVGSDTALPKFRARQMRRLPSASQIIYWQLGTILIKVRMQGDSPITEVPSHITALKEKPFACSSQGYRIYSWPQVASLKGLTLPQIQGKIIRLSIRWRISFHFYQRAY